MRPRSLSARLLWVSLGWSAFAVVATGIVLGAAFRDSVEDRFDDTLNNTLSDLIAELADLPAIDQGAEPPDLGQSRFSVPLSGWYWTVKETATGAVLMSSRSLAEDVFDPAEALPDPLTPGELYVAYATGPAGDPVRLAARRVTFEGGRWLLVVATGPAQSIDTDTQRFFGQLVLFLMGFATSLVAGTFLQWRFSLRPLTALRNELHAVQQGRQRHVSTDLPSEIAPVAEALNTLIDANNATLSRARQHVGNLAHALKTPISVLTNDAAANDGPLARSVREQTQTMQHQVRYYLDRAQMAARERVIGTATDVGPVLTRLQRAMARLGERRGVSVSLTQAGPVVFAGEQQDLEEIVGNLVDNAMKWASRAVIIRVRKVDLHNGAPRTFQVVIEDDGPGLTDAEQTIVLSRGARLDETKPGSGLGLSIVAELVELYHGSLRLGRARQGGLAVTVTLPMA